jgi:hypothetical protein
MGKSRPGSNSILLYGKYRKCEGTARIFYGFKNIVGLDNRMRWIYHFVSRPERTDSGSLPINTEYRLFTTKYIEKRKGEEL